MDSEIYSFALRNTLNEIQKLCPDITNAFIFNEDGEVISRDENTPEKTIVEAIDTVDSVLEKAEAMGNIEGIVLEGSKGRMNISCIDTFYFITVTSRKADMRYVNTVTRVLVPTIIRLLDKINPTPLKGNPSAVGEEPEAPTIRLEEETVEDPVEPTEHEETSKPQLETETKPILPEPPVSQFIVENIGGLLVPSDTVRIDNAVLTQWKDLYQDRKIEEAEIETFGGKSTHVKIKPIKDSKNEGKGIIQMPDKIQFSLDIRKGELVRVKPIVE